MGNGLWLCGRALWFPNRYGKQYGSVGNAKSREQGTPEIKSRATPLMPHIGSITVLRKQKPKLLLVIPQLIWSSLPRPTQKTLKPYP